MTKTLIIYKINIHFFKTLRHYNIVKPLLMPTQFISLCCGVQLIDKRF